MKDRSSILTLWKGKKSLLLTCRKALNLILSTRIKEDRSFTPKYNKNNNSSSPPLVDIVLFGLPLKVFKRQRRLLGRGLHTIIKNASFSSPTDVRSHNPLPFRAERPRWHSFPSPTNVGPPNPPPSGPVSFPAHCLGRSFHTLIKNASFSSPTDVGSHNPPLFGVERPRWHSFPSPIDVGHPNPPPSGPVSFLAHCLRRGFHTLKKNASFSSPTDVGSHNPPPSGLNVLTGTHSLLQPMWDPPPIHPLRGQRSFWHTASCPPPLELSLLTGTSPGVGLL